MLRRVLSLWGICAVVACLNVACATGEAPDPNASSCSAASDCPTGTTCDFARGVCLPQGQTNNQSNNANNGTVGETNNTNTNNGSNSNGSTNTTGPVTTGTTGTNGDVCTPACDAPDQCVDGVCEPLPPCGETLDLCDPTTTQPSGFVCVPIGDDEGLCLTSCNRPGTISGCPVGEYCLETDTTPACVPSICDEHADCTNGSTNGSCVHVNNEFNYCWAAGSLPAGSACTPGGPPQCSPGQYCESTTSRCEDFCDPYGAGCSDSDRYCARVFTEATSLCTTNIDPDAPLSPFSPCTTAGAACDDNSRCFGLQGGGAQCFAYCRPGENDCAGIAFNAQQTVCNPWVLSGVGLGLCWPPCSAGDCLDGDTCIDQVCRTSCTPGNEVTDCCGGDPDCPAYCNPMTQLCE